MLPMAKAGLNKFVLPACTFHMPWVSISQSSVGFMQGIFTQAN